MRKYNEEESLLDFNTGQTIIDDIAILRNHQNSLFTIKNPYVGNKRKIIVDISLALKTNNIQFNSVCDAFSGSGAVSLFFKLNNKNTFSNDILTSSYYNALAFVENNNVTLSEDEREYLYKNQNQNKNCFVEQNYIDKFTIEEAIFLDNYRANIEDLFADNLIKKAIAITQIEHFVINYCYVGGRLNKGQILATLEHRLKHQRNNGKQLDFASIDVLPLFTAKASSKCFNMDVFGFLDRSDIQSDLLYLDPPYGGQQSNYSDMFAFCEEYIYSKTISSLDHINNKFVSKKKYEDNFRQLLDKSKKFPYWAISYNESSWSDINHIKNILSDYKNDITVVSFDYKYKYRDKNNTKGLEYLILCKK